jgi:hypothetical protein
MKKNFWLNVFAGAASIVMASAVTGSVWLAASEIKFHVQVNERLAAIEQKLGIEPSNEQETHVAENK